MKHLFLSSVLMFIALVSNAQTATPNTSSAVITFQESSHDFGDIIEGTVVKYSFKFTNTGKEPLIISNVLTTCGCTVPVWPKEPILAGKTGSIDATFNSAGKNGKQNKVITVLTNAQNSNSQVTIISNVLSKPGDSMKVAPHDHTDHSGHKH